MPLDRGDLVEAVRSDRDGARVTICESLGEVKISAALAEQAREVAAAFSLGEEILSWLVNW